MVSKCCYVLIPVLVKRRGRDSLSPREIHTLIQPLISLGRAFVIFGAKSNLATASAKGLVHSLSLYNHKLQRSLLGLNATDLSLRSLPPTGFFQDLSIFCSLAIGEKKRPTTQNHAAIVIIIQGVFRVMCDVTFLPNSGLQVVYIFEFWSHVTSFFFYLYIVDWLIDWTDLWFTYT